MLLDTTLAGLEASIRGSNYVPLSSVEHLNHHSYYSYYGVASLKAVLDESTTGGVPGYLVATKIVKKQTGEGADEMHKEASVMAQLSSHPNVVSLIGVVTSGVPLLLLLSLCEYGSLLSVLKKKKPKEATKQRSFRTGLSWKRPAKKAPESEGNTTVGFTDKEKVKMLLEIARGMEYLISNQFVHRDLAARNILLNSARVCQVADFGLARSTGRAMTAAQQEEDGVAPEEQYYRSRTGTFPVRWTAPEAMATLRFSEASDVYNARFTPAFRARPCCWIARLLA
jgi:ephrin-B